MAITRKFLGCERRAVSATKYLLQRFGTGGVADLSSTVIVVPGRRAGRRLLEIMVDATERQAMAFTPPTIETVGRLPEQLYEPQRPFADEIVQQLVWADTLRNASHDLLAPIFARLPEKSEVAAWNDLGDALRRQHLDLAAESLNFQDVLAAGQRVEGFAETERWQSLAKLQRAYLDRLDELQLWIADPRLIAIEKHECTTDKQIILLGTADIAIALRKMIAQVSERVTALVVAPDSWSDRFDEIGCIRVDAWQQTHIDIDERQVHVVESPSDQVEQVARCIASYGGCFSPDQVTIGVPSESLVPQLQRQLGQCDLPTRWGPGTSLAETGPYRLMQALARYLDTERFHDLAAVARHPDADAWLRGNGIQGDWLTALDTFYTRHLPYRLDFDVADGSRSRSQAEEVVAAFNWPLVPLKGTLRTLDEWVEPLLRLLTAIYGKRTLNRNLESDRKTLIACEQIRDDVLSLQRVPKSLSPNFSAADALRVALSDTQQKAIPQVGGEPAIELLGWLELPLDDAPALIITNLNEGFVPSSVNSDLFLPNTIRQQLGLVDNDRRYARDAYALSVLLASREKLDLIVGRTTTEGDPVRPSRLLFATDAETIAQRTLAFLKSKPSQPETVMQDALTTDREVAVFAVPPPERVEPITSLSVTQFKAYLECPYRFYLGHVLRLTNSVDNADEMDGGLFGSLLHEVLTRFGHSPVCNSTDPAEIEEVLNKELGKCVRQQFGMYPLAAVRLQVEQARIRLLLFAEQQAKRAGAGWEIVYTEPLGSQRSSGDSKRVNFDVDGEEFEIRGRIDRIDQNRETGERIIFDYKTGDTAPKPEDGCKRGTWVDLQLPLYGHLDADSDIHKVKLGYIVLPKDSAGVEFRLAKWTGEQLAAADEAAERSFEV